MEPIWAPRLAADIAAALLLAPATAAAFAAAMERDDDDIQTFPVRVCRDRTRGGLAGDCRDVGLFQFKLQGQPLQRVTVSEVHTEPANFVEGNLRENDTVLELGGRPIEEFKDLTEVKDYVRDPKKKEIALLVSRKEQKEEKPARVLYEDLGAADKAKLQMVDLLPSPRLLPSKWYDAIELRLLQCAAAAQFRRAIRRNSETRCLLRRYSPLMKVDVGESRRRRFWLSAELPISGARYYGETHEYEVRSGLRSRVPLEHSDEWLAHHQGIGERLRARAYQLQQQYQLRTSGDDRSSYEAAPREATGRPTYATLLVYPCGDTLELTLTARSGMGDVCGGAAALLLPSFGGNAFIPATSGELPEQQWETRKVPLLSGLQTEVGELLIQLRYVSPLRSWATDARAIRMFSRRAIPRFTGT